MMRLPLMIPLLVLLLGPTPARAETLDESYKRAVQAHYAGKYEQAIEMMERILAVPMVHEDLHYNLGCAYFGLGKLGPAIYHFERALALDPSGDDARFNLETSRALAAAKVTDQLKGAARQPFWVRAVSTLEGQTWTVIFLVTWWITFILMLVLRQVQAGPLRAGLVAGTSFVAMVALLCGALFLGRVHLDRRVTHGIVLPDRLEVREGPSASAKSMFKLHAGFKVRLQARADNWIRIRLPNGLEGWAEAKTIGVL
mgnify:CR=1 FL=1